MLSPKKVTYISFDLVLNIRHILPSMSIKFINTTPTRKVHIGPSQIDGQRWLHGFVVWWMDGIYTGHLLDHGEVSAVKTPNNPTHSGCGRTGVRNNTNGPGRPVERGDLVFPRQGLELVVAWSKAWIGDYWSLDMHRRGILDLVDGLFVVEYGTATAMRDPRVGHNR